MSTDAKATLKASESEMQALIKTCNLSDTIGSVKQNDLRKIVIIFLSISLNMCFVCSKETSIPDGSFEYPQHMFWLRNKKNNFQVRTLI